MQAAGPQCPKCGVNLKDDYGMVTCESCGAILLVDMDGNVHVGTEQDSGDLGAPAEFETPQEDPPSTAPEPAITEWPLEQSSGDLGSEPAPGPTSDNWETPQAPSEDAPVPESGFDLGSLSNLDPMPEPPAEMPNSETGFDLAPPPEPEPVSTETGALPNAEETPPEEFNMDALLGYQQPEQNPEGGGDFLEGGDLAPPGDPLGLNEYANSEISQAKDGLLVFKLLISGIDSKEIRESIREAMEDARFGWDADSIIGQIEKGELTIENLSPVKATILINRIKRLPIQIRWEQYAITQIDEGGGTF